MADEAKAEASFDILDGFEFSPGKVKEYSLTPKSPKEGDDVETEAEKENEAKPVVLLEPDHPLLERFQRVLKAHLTKQIDRLKEEVAELEIGTKKKNIEREQVGLEVYEMQQSVIKQQREIDACVSQLETVSAAREEIEVEVRGALTKQHKEEKNRLIEAEKKEIELRTEMESVNLLIHQMSKWENDIESELVINQRMAEKTRKDKLKLAIDKKDQDMLVYKLMTEVWRLEGELETMVKQLRVKEEEREKLAESIFLSNIDIEANEADHRCLIHGWQSLLVTITNKDKHCNKLMEEYNKLEEKYTTLNCEIVQAKKLCNKELCQNETLSVFKERVDTQLKAAHRQLTLELDKRNNIENAMLQCEALREQINKDIARVKSENNKLTVDLNDVLKEFDKVTSRKLSIEEDIFRCIQEQLENTNMAKNYQRIVKSWKESSRNSKIAICKFESMIAKASTDLQNCESDNLQTSKIIEELQAKIYVEDAELIDATNEYDRCGKELERKLRMHALFTKKYEKLMAERGGLDLSPHELKIKQLEGFILDNQDKNKEMQSFWLREQSIVVDLTEKRGVQIRDMNLLKKQISILDQKNLKINDELANYKAQEDLMTRSTNSLQNKLAAFTEILNKKKDSKECIDTINNNTQIELLSRLEEAEMEAVKLKSELADIEEDKLALSNSLIEKNREALCWEKKIQMLLEARKDIQQELSQDGEIGKMKTEIHRMEVRLSQLKRAQEKLIQDLEYCVTRRENIVLVAEAKTKYLKGGIQQARINFTKKLDDMKNKIMQMESEKENVGRKIEMKEHEIERMQKEIDISEAELSSLKKQVADVISEIDRSKVNKQLNLDILLFKQRKVKVYTELSRGRLPFTIYKTASSAHVVYDKEKETNAKLRTVIENLLTDFPNHNIVLTKMHNSLVILALTL